jgi:hypothetical protein
MIAPDSQEYDVDEIPGKPDSDGQPRRVLGDAAT